jgi:hypothetical protein
MYVFVESLEGTIVDAILCRTSFLSAGWCQFAENATLEQARGVITVAAIVLSMDQTENLVPV